MSLRSRWIKALRSGEYKQGTGCLKDGDKFCCLGVFLDLKDPKGWQGESGAWAVGANRCGSMMLPQTPTLLKQMGLAFEDVKRLADMNDDGKTFEEIANVIVEMR